jgi:ketopantoate reductase
MNPVEAVMGPVCGTCARENHAQAVGKQRADKILKVAREQGQEAGRKEFTKTVLEILKK